MVKTHNNSAVLVGNVNLFGDAAESVDGVGACVAEPDHHNALPRKLFRPIRVSVSLLNL